MVGTRIPPFFKRKRLIPEQPAPQLPEVPGPAVAPAPVDLGVDHPSPPPSEASDISIEGAREALDEAQPLYLPLTEARRRLEGGGDLPGNEGVGESGGQEGPRFTRLRKRAAWINEGCASLRRWVPGELREPVIGGGKASFQGIRGYLRSMFGPEVELVAGQRVEIGEESAEGVRQTDVLLKLTVNSGVDELKVSLGILVRLVAFFTFRKLDKGSLMLARGKAVQYAKDLGLSPEHLALVIAGTVTIALMGTVYENHSRRALRVRHGGIFDEDKPETLFGWFGWVTAAPGVASYEYYVAAPDPDKASRLFVAISEYVTPTLSAYLAPKVASWWNAQRSGQ